MTQSAHFQAISVRALSRLVAEWPQRGADGAPTLVLLGDAYPDAASPPTLAVSAAAMELDDGGSQHLVLYPEQREIPQPATIGDHADALDLALAALSYSLTTPMALYDPEKASALAVRAVTAISAVKRFERGLFL